MLRIMSVGLFLAVLCVQCFGAAAAPSTATPPAAVAKVASIDSDAATLKKMLAESQRENAAMRRILGRQEKQITTLALAAKLPAREGGADGEQPPANTGREDRLQPGMWTYLPMMAITKRPNQFFPRWRVELWNQGLDTAYCRESVAKTILYQFLRPRDAKDPTSEQVVGISLEYGAKPENVSFQLGFAVAHGYVPAAEAVKLVATFSLPPLPTPDTYRREPGR